MTVCAYEGCLDEKIRSRGYCGKHYQKLYNAGLLEKKNGSRAGKCCAKGCDLPVHARFRCQKHYTRILVKEKRNLKPGKAECKFPNCGNRHKAKGYCKGHYAQLWRGVELHELKEYGDYQSECSIEGCSNKHKAKGYCIRHYGQISRGTITPEGMSKAQIKYNNMVEDTEDLIDFGETRVEELAKRVGWRTPKQMIARIPKELREKLERLNNEEW